VAIPQETIDTIRDRVDIADIVAQYVDLRRSGSYLKGLCPFHDEKTPSFFVSPDRQIYHCYGCGEGGNVFNFMMEMEGVSFPEAVSELGKRCGVEVVSRMVPPEERSKSEALYGANAFAARYYYDQLLDERVGASARGYLEERGFDATIWKRFGLGFAAPAWDGLLQVAERKRIPIDLLRQLKLVLPRDNGRGHFDYFRSRIIFPIISVSGRVVGFGGRAAAADVEPKYLNSAESPVFTKGRTFYGLNHARDAIRSEKRVLVVEGYTDLIRLHMVGLEHTVAACGTALTVDHAKMLRRLTSNVTLIPDGDPAGRAAAAATGAVLVGAGLEVSVVRLPDDADPDSSAQELGRDGLLELISGSMGYFDYVRHVVREEGRPLREEEALIRRVVTGAEQGDDPVRRDLILGELGRRLGVRLRPSRAARTPREPDKGGEVAAPDAIIDPKRLGIERLVLRLVLEGTPVALDALDSLDRDDFSSENHRNLYNLLDLARETHIDLRSQDFQRKAEEAGLAPLATEIALITLPPGNVEEILKDTIRRIKEYKIRDELGALRARLEALPSESEEAVAVAEYYRKLQQALVEL